MLDDLIGFCVVPVVQVKSRNIREEVRHLLVRELLQGQLHQAVQGSPVVIGHFHVVVALEGVLDQQSQLQDHHAVLLSVAHQGKELDDALDDVHYRVLFLQLSLALLLF